MRWLRTVLDLEYAAGVELFADAANRARLVFDDVVVGDVETLELPFAPHDFDLILGLDVLEHLKDPWHVVRKLHGLLRPGGAIVVSLPNIAHYSVSFPLLLRGRWNYATEGLLDQTHLRFFVQRTAAELMTSSGLVIDKRDRVVRLPHWMNIWARRFGGYHARWYLYKLIKLLRLSYMVDYQFLLRVTYAGGGG